MSEGVKFEYRVASSYPIEGGPIIQNGNEVNIMHLDKTGSSVGKIIEIRVYDTGNIYIVTDDYSEPISLARYRIEKSGNYLNMFWQDIN